MDCHGIICARPHWLSSRHKNMLKESELLICGVRTRHREDISRCTLYPILDSDNVEVELALPLNGKAAPGQFAVFYDDNECIGSASILKLKTGIDCNDERNASVSL